MWWLCTLPRTLPPQHAIRCLWVPRRSSVASVSCISSFVLHPLLLLKLHGVWVFFTAFHTHAIYNFEWLRASAAFPFPSGGIRFSLFLFSKNVFPRNSVYSRGQYIHLLLLFLFGSVIFFPKQKCSCKHFRHSFPTSKARENKQLFELLYKVMTPWCSLRG